MRHVRMWHWLFLLLVVLVLSFVEAEHGETRAASLAQSAESQADSPVLLNETPEGSSGWRMVGQVGGPTQAVAVQGNYAYVGVGLRLVVLDVSNPITPTEVGSTTPFPYFVEDVVVSGTLAYVAAGGAGLRVVDVLTPTALVEVGFWDSPGYAEGVAVAGSTVYLADGPYGLWIVDVSDPTHPRKVGSAYDMNYAFEVAVSQDYAYIAAAGAGLLIADVTDPAQPLEVGALDTPGYAYGIAVSGSTAYVADAWEGLRVIDVSNPAHSVELAACDTPGWALNVAVAGAIAYVADGAFGLRVVDVSDKAESREIGAYEEYGLARRIAVSGSAAFVADQRNGLRVVDIADQTHPHPVNLYSPLTNARQVAVAGNYAYVTAGFLGLRVVEISDTAHPTEIAAYEIEGAYTDDVVVSGNYAYLTTTMYGPYSLHVLDISDPAHPTRVSTIPMNNYQEYKDLALVDDILYVAYGWGLQLIDVSNPAAPVKLGFIELPVLQDTQDVAVSGTIAYVADFFDGVKIVDVSNPISPTLVGIYDSPLASLGVAVAGNLLFVAEHSFGLRVVDVSDPSSPVEIGFCDTPGIAQSVTISGTEAYVGDSGGGMIVVDVSNPFTPTLVTAADTAGIAYNTTLVGKYAYIADGHGGLVILERVAGSTATSFIDVADTTVGTFTSTRAAGRSEPQVITMAAAPVNNTTRVPPHRLTFATTRVVTSTLNSGPGTLRQALLDAGTGDTIIFNPAVFPPAKPTTITLESELPPVEQGYLTIDASNAGVILNGSNLPGTAHGLLIWSDHNVVRGLQIMHFAGSGVNVDASYNIIGGDRTKGIGPTGQGNVISENGNGIDLHGPDHTNNTIVGNFIGVDASGTKPLGNVQGIQICCGASHNRIGGSTPGEHNIVSGNATGISLINGVSLTLTMRVNANVITGNYIGTDVHGLHALGNDVFGVVIWDGPCGNTVEGNLISGNLGDGVMIAGIDANHNALIGNIIGADANGTQPLGNRGPAGVHLCGAGYNRVEGNLISGNTGAGIAVCDGGWPHSLIRGNYIGTDVSGARLLGNGGGIGIDGWHVLVGGTTPAERNVIASNQGLGIDVANAGAEYNWLAGNVIGTDASGTIPLGNGWAGVGLWNYSAHNFVQGNTLAFNGGNGWDAGVFVARSAFNTIRRNSIYENLGRGIFLAEDANKMLPAPIILAVTPTSVSGTACPGCTVEVFFDAEDEGRSYEGSTAADVSGAFTFTRAGGLIGPYVTATATDRDGNTSEFSTPHKAWARICLPVILKSKL